MMRIAVLMTCFNRVSTTVECLKKLFSQQLSEEYHLDVFLVDDASPDQTGRIVREGFPSVHVTVSSGGLFWCRGMRLAWDAAVNFSKGETPFDFYLWLNDDVMMKEGALASLLCDWSKVSGVIVGTFSSDSAERDVSYGATNKIPNGEPQKANKGMNGNMVLIPRHVYEKVGPIYGGYHHQYGDYDYGMAVRRAGLEYYSSSKFCGVCPEQPDRYLHLKGRSLLSRWSLLFSPKGYSLHDAFIYKYRNWGLMRASLSAFHVTLRVTFALEG